MKCRLTVILGNYNYAHYLPDCLDALLNQTRPADEIIVIDDASTDNSVDVISSYLSRHPNIRLIRNPVNQGANRNVNRLMKIAQGEIVHFAPSDDVVYPTLFERGMGLMEAHPGAALFSAQTHAIDAAGKNIGLFHTPMPLSKPGYLDPDGCARSLMRDGPWFMGNTMLIRREPLIAEGGFPEELSAVADSFVTQLLAVKYGACYSPEALAGWRRIRQGASWSATANFDGAKQIADRCKDEMKKHGQVFPDGYAELWHARYLFGARRVILSEERRNTRPDEPLKQFLMRMREIAMTLWLFLRMRPHDVWPVFSRRIRKALCG